MAVGGEGVKTLADVVDSEKLNVKVDGDFLTKEELASLKKAVELYLIIKPIVLAAEERSGSAFMPAVTNLRDSYDHLMRVFSVKFEIKEAKKESIDVNLNAAYGHLYRACFDTLDYCGIILREKIEESLKNMPVESISAAIPEYFIEIKPACYDAEKLFAKCRNDKDIGSVSKDDITKYIDCVNQLEEHLKLIERKMPSIVDHKKRTAKKDRNLYWKTLIITVAGSIIGVIAGALFF